MKTQDNLKHLARYTAIKKTALHVFDRHARDFTSKTHVKENRFWFAIDCLTWLIGASSNRAERAPTHALFFLFFFPPLFFPQVNWKGSDPCVRRLARSRSCPLETDDPGQREKKKTTKSA